VDYGYDYDYVYGGWLVHANCMTASPPELVYLKQDGDPARHRALRSRLSGIDLPRQCRCTGPFEPICSFWYCTVYNTSYCSVDWSHLVSVVASYPGSSHISSADYS